MKIFSEKKHFNTFIQIFFAAVFFAVSGIVFFKYSIDMSPLIFFLFLLIYAVYLKKINPVILYPHDLFLLASLAVFIAIFPVVTLRLSGYAIPVIGFIILITLLFDNLEFSFLFALFFFSLSASIEGDNLTIGTSLFAGGFTAALLSLRVRKRFEVIKAGVIAGLVQFLVAFIIERVKQEQGFVTSLNPDLNLLTICFLNGLGASLVLAILPIFEYIFRVLTNISLLELSDLNHPLLRRLILEAPGTYQHSLVVANLSEAAADAIGANSLLARVGAYYHDIGKMLKPNYFVENIVGFKDIHKDLKPSMSKLIIMNHVKEGIELAKKYRLNPRIIDFINEHHGKTLVYYFYRRAKELEPEKQHEEDYRYSGPKPQSKEAAIVSLADTVEALSRTLDEPTPSRIEEMIKETVKKRFMEGELDESNLTLKDLEKITQSFIHMLNALFHTRVNYPKDETGQKQKAKDNSTT